MNMKKIVLLSCFGLALTSSCLASPLDQLLAKVTPLEKSTHKASHDPDEEGYTDFSGVWVGTCDNDPDITETVDIQTTDSLFIIDGDRYDIDAVTTKGVKNNLNFTETVVHFRWNEDGSQLLASSLNYYVAGYMTKEKMTSMIGNMTLSMENNQLVTRLSGYVYADGIHLEEFDTKYSCTYNRKSN